MLPAVEVIIEDNKKHPYCSHGPTLLFLRNKDNGRKFFACAACRDRKDCSFFLWEDELSKFSDVKKQFWDNQRLKFLKQLPPHQDLFLKFYKIKQILPSKRYYCHDCHKLYTDSEQNRHKNHDTLSNISNELLENPSKIFKPKDNAKKEAQYLFSNTAVKTIIDNIIHLKLRHIICIGAPRIHEYIQNNLLDQGYSSLLLDIDERFRHFFGPLQFCLYNSFNHYFFEGKISENVFNDYLQNDNGNGIAIVTDPPFGGRIEALSDGIQKITTQYKNLNKTSKDLPIFWIFPYFMESHILNSFSNFSMLDYKVDYDNHSLFTEKPNGRKNGSPVRIFTNITPSDFVLPSGEGYKYCGVCKKWVSQENKHCIFCNGCTSKNGTTYKHCNICNRCVKPSWNHCSTCNRCCLQDHKCAQIEFNNNCFHCKLPGHKKNDCPNINESSTKRKRLGTVISNQEFSSKDMNWMMINHYDKKILLDYEVLTTFYSEINDAEYQIILMKIDFLMKNYTNKCDICPKSFSKDEYLQKHILNQHETTKSEKMNNTCFIGTNNILHEDSKMVLKIESNEIKEDCGSNEGDVDVITEDIDDIHIGDIDDIHTGNIEYKSGLENKQKSFDIERNEYKCSICVVIFKTNQGYQNHLRAHRMGRRKKIQIYKCTKCSERFITSQRLTFHMKSNHNANNEDNSVNDNESIYKCNKCFRTFIRPQGLSIHMKSHENDQFILKDMYTSDGLLQCSACSKTYASYKTLKRHYEQNHKIQENEQLKENNFECQKCSSFFINSDELNEHKKIHSLEKFNKKWLCDICKRKFRYEKSRDDHIREQHNGRFRSHLCTICGKSYNRNQQLLGHMKQVHSGIKPFLCSVCGKAFSTKRFLEAHSRTHTKEKPFKCDECGKGFIHKPNMIEHKRIHSGLKPHVCTKCGKQFTHLTGLRQHSVYHTGIKKYSCSICDKKFYFKNKCDDHMRLHSGELPYSCKYCDKKFRICNGLKRHTRACRGIRDFKCNICEKTFTENSHLKQHMKIHERAKNQINKSVVFPKIDDVSLLRKHK